MSKLVDKILEEGYTLPNSVKKLNVNKLGFSWKDMDVNTIFKHKFVQKYRNKWKQLEEKYYATGCRKRYGGDFFNTGMEKRMVNVNDIYPGQTGVLGTALEAIINGDTNHTPSSEIPEAIRLYDKKINTWITMLVDGHHRVAADILKGKTQVELNIKVDKFQ